MPARRGEDYVQGLHDGRCVWLEGEPVADVAGHPAFQGAIRTLAALFDLQHAASEDCLFPHPTTGEPVNASHLVPRSTGDLLRRHRALRRTAELSAGLLGRSPDYLNVTFACLGTTRLPEARSIADVESPQALRTFAAPGSCPT